MSDWVHVPQEFLATIVSVARELPPPTLKALIAAFQANAARSGLERFAASPAAKTWLRELERAWELSPEVDARAVSLAIAASIEMSSSYARANGVQIAWTGPATEAVPVRRVDQVLYDLIESAGKEILLVTYAAYKANHALTALRRASERGVVVKLVIELARERGGKLSFDGLSAIKEAIPASKIFYWPPARRKLASPDALGSMHAKCLVADRKRAMISSANLTNSALEANMELGLVVETFVASRLADHFDQLVLRGELVEVS